VKGRLDRGTGHPGLLQKIKGGSHDRVLHFGVPGLPAGVSQGEVGEHEAGDPAFLHDVAGGSHQYRRQAVLFEVPGDQTHGLVADRSEGREEHGVDAVLTAPCENLRCKATQRLSLAVMGRHTVETA
jgi:hypothetical protein